MSWLESAGGNVQQEGKRSADYWSRLAERLASCLRRGCVLINEPMRQHTSFRIGGPADIFVEPYDMNELGTVLRICSETGNKPTVVGNGTNLLVSDLGIRGVVIHVSDNLSRIQVDGEEITAEAGISLVKLASEALAHSLTGLEFASGIPGSLGGAVAMNAGAYGGEMKDVVTEARCFSQDGELIHLVGEQLEFGYRTSSIQTHGYIVAEAVMRLQYGDRDAIRAKMNELNALRREKQPLSLPSAGSVFKRPPGYFAGKLIQDAGLRGYRIGGAQVSEKHCGFIVNVGGATASDVLQLIRHVQKEVKAQFGVELETEVRIIGEWPEGKA